MRTRRKSKGSAAAWVLVVLLAAGAIFLGIKMKSYGDETVELKKENQTLQSDVDQMKQQIEELTKTVEERDKEKKTLEDQVEDLKEQLSAKGRAVVASGKNHNAEAASYAYDTKKVKAAMAGKEKLSDKKVAFLTFDDGVNTKITPQVLDVLKKEGVPATFFIQCSSLNDSTQSVLKREMAEGHAIAMHSMSHDYSKLYPGRVGDTQQILSEVDQCQKVLQTYLGKDFYSKVFRYPGGHMSWKGLDEADAQMEAKGIQWIDWNCMNGDAEPKSRRPGTVEGMVKFLKSGISSSADVVVVLMHDSTTKQLTVDALPQMIQALRDMGFTFGILT